LHSRVLQESVNEESSANAKKVEEEKMFQEIVDKFFTSIQKEKGLDRQNFRCNSCKKSIGLTFSKYKLCALDGMYYCEICFESGVLNIIPSRLIYNWDSRPRLVHPNNKILLDRINDRPFIRIDVLNPALYHHCPTMNTAKILREKLSFAAMYLLSCRDSVAHDLQMRVWPKEYLYNDIHLYSFSDLITVLSGQFQRHLSSILSYAVNHIHACILCSQKGYLCEICPSNDVIYPFEIETTFRCNICFSLYHKKCIGEMSCPKCIRKEFYANCQTN
uniref:DUF4206 domain-containing protein n=1 Tax=Dracunculus medinensis TaxID=318479 RepID=A0A0N4U387_DRAME